MTIFLKRVYESASDDDGERILVDRLWPRGLKKEDAKIDDWIKDVAPSDGLRKWYGHDPDKWKKFKSRYWKELDEKRSIVKYLVEKNKQGKITFVYGSKETELNNAKALKEYIETKFE